MSVDPIKVKAVFLKAVAACEPGNWTEFLNEACEGDSDLRRRVEVLLNAHLGQDSLFDEPAGSSPTLDQPLRERPGTQIGPYKLLQEIGQGGMGVVYMAEQQEPVRRKVALKIIKPGMDSRQVIARFEAERQALSLMDHPNIARVLDAGTTPNGRPFFVMELVKDQPITEYCDEHHLTPRERLEMLVPVCHAIQHAHQKGIIHRDIKPSNILVAENDQQAVPKVIDFGVAKAISQPLTEETMFTGLGQIVGTLEYMSPEQAKVNPLDIDTRSDIYSLGVLMYELLTGTTPFDKQRLRSAAWDEMLRIIREEDPPKPSTKLSDSRGLLPSMSAQRDTDPAKLTKIVRGELDWIVMKAMHKDRARRYETASALAADLQRFLNDEPVEASPTSRSYRLRKLLRRYKVALTTIALLIVALLVGIAGTSWQALRANRALTRALVAEQRASENLERAMQAVDQLLTRIATERLAGVPQMSLVRRDLLIDAEELYKRLAHANPERPDLVLDVAVANRRLARIQFELEDLDAARKSAGRALELLSAQVAPEGDRSRWKLEAAETQLLLGRMERAAPEKCLQLFQQTLQTLDGLTVDAAMAPRVLDARAETYRLLAQHLRTMGRFDEAAQAFDEGSRVFEQLIVQASDVAAKQVAYAKHRLNHANLQAHRGDNAAEADLCRCAIQQLRALPEPLEAEAQMVLGTALMNLAAALSRADRLDEAIALCEQSVTLQEKLVREYPLIPEFRQRLANALLNLGAFQSCHHHLDKAIDTCERAVEHTRFLAMSFGDNAQYHHLYSGALNNLVIALEHQDQVDLRSEELLKEAIEHQQQALQHNPQHYQFRTFLLNQYYTLATIESKLNKIHEAVDARQRGLDVGRTLLSEQPANEAVSKVVTELESMQLADVPAEVGS